MNFTTEDLQFYLENANIPLSEYSHIENMIKEKEVKKVHTNKISNREDGRSYTYVKVNGKNKQITAYSEVDLYNQLYDFYYGFKNSTFEQLYETWIVWLKNELGRSDKTIEEYRRLWKKYFLGEDIIKKRIKDLTPDDFITLFRELTKGKKLKNKAFITLKSIPSGILNYACEKQIITHNCLNSINYGQFPFKVEKIKKNPLNLDELKLLSAAIEDKDLYDLAIHLSLYMPLRIGEIKGLMWDDVHGDMIYIERQVLDSKEIKDAPKGETEDGFRYIHLTKEAMNILYKIKELNPDNPFLFFRGNEPLSKCTYNRRLKSYCKKAKIKQLPSHQMRFSVASILFKMGVQATELQIMLGHTTLAMTLHYLKNVTPTKETSQKMENILILG